ncbi:hypothetical protein L9F63_000392, partial [Diploptera punctata]
LMIWTAHWLRRTSTLTMLSSPKYRRRYNSRTRVRNSHFPGYYFPTTTIRRISDFLTISPTVYNLQVYFIPQSTDERLCWLKL